MRTTFFSSSWPRLASIAIVLAMGALSAHSQAPVVITQHPVPNLTVTQGGSIDLSVEYSVVSPDPASVGAAWRLDGAWLVGYSNTNRLQLSNVVAFEAGVFDAVVFYSTLFSSYAVTSSPCVVRVLSAPVIKDVTFSNQTFGFSFDTVRFRSEAVPGMTNIIEGRDDLGTNGPSSWTPLLSTVADGNAFHFSITNSAATPLASRRFYRVRVE